MNYSLFISIGMAALVLLVVPACKKQSKAASQSSTNVVSQVVFVDKEVCCECTKNRIDGSWEALSNAIKDKDLKIERLHQDTQETEVSPYQEMRPIMVIPAIYLLDSEGNLIEVLQGEVTEDQIKALL